MAFYTYNHGSKKYTVRCIFLCVERNATNAETLKNPDNQRSHPSGRTSCAAKNALTFSTVVVGLIGFTANSSAP